MNWRTDIDWGAAAAGVAGWTAGGLCAALLLGGALHRAAHALGWLRGSAEPARKWNAWLLALALAWCGAIGGWTGLTVGLARAGVAVLTEQGPKLAQAALDEGLRAAGLTNAPAVDAAEVARWLDAVEKAPLPPLDIPGAAEWRGRIEALRTPLLLRIREGLAKAPQGKLAIGEWVAAFWPRVSGELTGWAGSFTRWEILTGLAWVCGVEVFLVLSCLAVRGLRGKAAAAPADRPSKLESWPPRTN